MFSCFLSLKSRLRRTRSTQHKQFPECRSHPVLQMSLRRQPTLSACLSAAHLTIQTRKLHSLCQERFPLSKVSITERGTFLYILRIPFLHLRGEPIILSSLTLYALCLAPEDLLHTTFLLTVPVFPSLRFAPSLFHSPHHFPRHLRLIWYIPSSLLYFSCSHNQWSFAVPIETAQEDCEMKADTKYVTNMQIL